MGQYHAPGLGPVNLSQFTHHLPKLGYSSQGRGGSLTTSNNRRVILTLCISDRAQLMGAM